MFTGITGVHRCVQVCTDDLSNRPSPGVKGGQQVSPVSGQCTGVQVCGQCTGVYRYAGSVQVCTGMWVVYTRAQVCG